MRSKTFNLLAALWMFGGILARGELMPPPVIFWASDPVAPGETVLVTGSGLSEQPKVEVVRLPDGTATQPAEGAPDWSHAARPAVQQPSDQSLKFTIPDNLSPGVFAYRISTAGGTTTGFVNRPVIDWLQGAPGAAVSPGGWVRLFGRNLGWTAKIPRASKLLLRGPRTLMLSLEADTWSARTQLPGDLPPGDYEVRLHNSAGGNSAWSEPVTLHVDPIPLWPATTYNVRDFGADGLGTHDDTAPIQAALDKAGAAGGGVVLLPRGRYQINDTLTIPRFTVLCGESEDATCLFWPDSPKPPDALIRGTNHFAVEELTIYAGNHRGVLVGDTGDKPDSGYVRFSKVRIRADAYRGHLKPEEVDQRFRESLKLSSGGADSIRVGGTGVEIGECDVYGSGRSLYLSRVRSGWVHDNQLSNGRWGWYCISGSDGLIFEHNHIQGADLMSTGGGLNCLDGSRYSQNVFYSHNEISETNGWDRESMTSDAGGGPYAGKISTCQYAQLTLPSAPEWKGDWTGAGVFVLRGHGAGQVRRVAKTDGATVTLDQPFTEPLGPTSEIAITQYQGHYLLVGNQFTDCGPVQFYGTAIENIVAANTGARMQGFKALGINYYGIQPCLRNQFLGNQLSQNYYHWTNATDTVMELTAQKPGMNQAAVLRNNTLSDNASIRLETVSDSLVEKNTVSDTDTGIFASKTCERLLITGNHFARVAHETVDEAGEWAAMQERIKAYMGRPDPIAAYDFESFASDKFADASGNHFSASVVGGVKPVPDGHKGAAASFDGTGYLQINEPALFNAPDITLDLWIKPASLTGRRGLIAKRLDGSLTPIVICQMNSSVSVEASTVDEKWLFNLVGPPTLAIGKWTRVTVVFKQGDGVRLYLDGKLAAEKKVTESRSQNSYPLIIGREAWGGGPPGNDTPGFFIGEIDDIKIWTRALTVEEISRSGN